MPRYIDADELMANITTGCCQDCDRRKGIKNGKYRIVYEIGGAPCRSCGINDAIDWICAAGEADAVPVVRCKDCKHFEYDHPYIIQGIPLLGHEVCNAWGAGCKTDENGYCFMAERRTDE